MENIEDFPSQVILPLTVRDPRVFLPQKRIKVLLNNEETDEEVEEEQMEVNGKEDDPQKEKDVLAAFLKKALNPLEYPEILPKAVQGKMTDHEF